MHSMKEANFEDYLKDLNKYVKHTFFFPLVLREPRNV